MEYILFIHKNEALSASADQWSTFFACARKSGWFAGGSEISTGELIGATGVHKVSQQLAGYMRFDTGDDAKGLAAIHQLLLIHPTVLAGGTVELCETPRTD